MKIMFYYGTLLQCYVPLWDYNLPNYEFRMVCLEIFYVILCIVVLIIRIGLFQKILHNKSRV